MSEHKISTDLFSFPYRGKHIIYAPFKQVAFIANDALMNWLASLSNGSKEAEDGKIANHIIDFLAKQGIIDLGEEKLPFVRDRGAFFPTAVTLFPTNSCNLRCLYCYASAGEITPKQMSWEIAKTAIDLVAQNAAQAKAQQFGVGFHGGGEPFVAWSLLTKCVEYARSLSKQLQIEVKCPSATNGVLTESQTDWVLENMTSLSVSLDGPPEVQNFQRPMDNGAESYPAVESFLKKLDQAGFDYGIRSTITDYNVERMAEMVEFFHANFNTKQVQFEPLFVCGRCLTSPLRAPEPGRFMSHFYKALDQAEKYQINLTYSGLRLGILTNTFCGACSDNFSITPEGKVTSCFEVLEKADPRSSLFFYGEYQPESNEFIIDEQNRNKLLGLTVEKMDFCSDCLAKWHCAGDCLSKVTFEGEALGARRSPRCRMNQQMTKRSLRRLLASKGRKPEDFIAAVIQPGSEHNLQPALQ